MTHESLELLFVSDFGVISDSDKGQQVLVYRAWIDGGQITSDDSFTFQALYPRVDCRRGEAKPLANRGVCNPGVILN